MEIGMEIEEGVPTEPAVADDRDTATREAASATSDQAAAEGEAGVSTEHETFHSEPSEASQPALEPPGTGEDGDIDVTNSNDGVDECAVCLCLLCEPVELGCSHTFCRMCAYKALHGRTAACPLCRSPQPSPQQPEDLPLAQNRADAIAARYPAEVLRERAEAAQAEREVFERELARRREFHFFVMHAPGFGVRSASALHLFEPRYRLLAARAIAENDGRFGFVTSGSPTVGAVGVVARILRHRRNFNGSYDIVIVGEREFTVETISATAVPDEYGGPTCPQLMAGDVSFTSDGPSLPAVAAGAANGGGAGGDRAGSGGGACVLM